jgi:predicted short-subunit dehydrogenase-like oxidoreductase (DUF2520 family)
MLTPSSQSRQTVAVIGAGKVGTAMAHLLSKAGYDVAAVYDVKAEARERAALMSGAKPVDTPGEAAEDAQVILITTPDGEIEESCGQLVSSGASLQGKKVIHMSGALSLAALEQAAGAGAGILSIHPIQTFADLQGAESSLPGSTFGVTCSQELVDWARDFVASLEGRVMLVDDCDKVLYHSAAAIASNLLAMVEYGSYVISRRLGATDPETAEAFTPLVRATVDNISRLGPAEALTGPLARGDVETLRDVQVGFQLGPAAGGGEGHAGPARNS